MWYSVVNNNKNLLKLYDNIPELIDIRIDRLVILPEEKEIKLVFDMPKFFDYLPENQTKLKDNVAVIEISFKNVDNLVIDFDVSMSKANIFITKNLEDKLLVNMGGSINCSFIANYSVIEKIRTYFI